MKKQPLLLIVGLLFALANQNAMAQLKIGVVNPIKLMEQAPQVEDANTRLKQEFSPRERRLISAGQEIKNLEERLSKNRAVMSESAIRENIRKIRNKQINFARQQQEFQEDYNTRRQQELSQIQKLINQIIDGLVSTESYDLILSDGVIWANDKVDITDKVLRQLRQKHRSERNW